MVLARVMMNWIGLSYKVVAFTVSGFVYLLIDYLPTSTRFTHSGSVK